MVASAWARRKAPVAQKVHILGSHAPRSAAHMTHRATARMANTQSDVILTRLKTSTVDRRKMTGARNSPVSSVSRA